MKRTGDKEGNEADDNKRMKLMVKKGMKPYNETDEYISYVFISIFNCFGTHI